MPRRHEDSDDRERPRRKLKSLAQTARGNQLKQIRGTLIAIGVLMILWHLADGAVSIGKGPGPLPVGPAMPNNNAWFYVGVAVVEGLGILLGAVFIVLGALISWYPVPISIAGLVLYVLYTVSCVPVLIFSMVNAPASGGAIFQIVFRLALVVALAKAVYTAFVYERERRAEQDDVAAEDDDE